MGLPYRQCIFCDVFTLMHSPELRQIIDGQVGDVVLTEEFLLTSGFIMEIPMLMIVLSRVLKYKANRLMNIVFGFVLFLVQLRSLMVGDNSLHYIFFSIIEMGSCTFIVWYAWQWREESLKPLTHGTK